MIPTCSDCNGLVKPDIVFFGEQLPDRFSECAARDFRQCDLLIVMGTSLTVQPFASLVDRVRDDCPRLLINLTKAGAADSAADFMMRLLGRGGGMDFDSEDAYRDVAKLSTCDEGCRELTDKLGWAVGDSGDFSMIFSSQSVIFLPGRIGCVGGARSFIARRQR